MPYILNELHGFLFFSALSLALRCNKYGLVLFFLQLRAAHFGPCIFLYLSLFFRVLGLVQMQEGDITIGPIFFLSRSVPIGPSPWTPLPF